MRERILSSVISRAVPADDADDLTLPDLERHIVERPDGAPVPRAHTGGTRSREARERVAQRLIAFDLRADGVALARCSTRMAMSDTCQMTSAKRAFARRKNTRPAVSIAITTTAEAATIGPGEGPRRAPSGTPRPRQSSVQAVQQPPLLRHERRRVGHRVANIQNCIRTHDVPDVAVEHGQRREPERRREGSRHASTTSNGSQTIAALGTT